LGRRFNAIAEGRGDIGFFATFWAHRSSIQLPIAVSYCEWIAFIIDDHPTGTSNQPVAQDPRPVEIEVEVGVEDANTMDLEMPLCVKNLNNLCYSLPLISTCSKVIFVLGSLISMVIRY
jgi:hypothetical protein